MGLPKPTSDMIGRTMRMDYLFSSKSGTKASPKRQNREFHYVVIVSLVGPDMVAVAPISHERSKDSSGDISLEKPHAQAAGLDITRPSYIENGQYNIVHRNSSSIQVDRRTQQVLGGRLPPTIVGKLKSDFEKQFKAKSFVKQPRIHQDDTSRFRHPTKSLAKDRPSDAERQQEFRQKAQGVKFRGGTLSLGGKPIKSGPKKDPERHSVPTADHRE
jgi:hypothetical protein